MNLKTYIGGLERGGAAEFAAGLEVSPSFLSQMASGKAPISPARSVKIEQLTKGVVRRQDTRPTDYADIWPELAEKVSA